MSFVSI